MPTPHPMYFVDVLLAVCVLLFRVQIIIAGLVYDL